MIAVPSHWSPRPLKQHAKVGEYKSTAICGNDLLSSCLYCSAIVVSCAGWLAPVSLLLVSGVLKLYQGVYSENGQALPFNGGVYTAALNSLTKPKACICACFSIMSYIATCVMSASSGVLYFLGFLNVDSDEVYMASAIAVIIAVGLLYIWGISESATVALVIFCAHVTLLVTLVLSSAVRIIFFDDFELITAAFAQPLPYPWWQCILYGFASGMLGITGFETSCNYIEEQVSPPSCCDPQHLE